jgi:hypothetical protein
MTMTVLGDLWWERPYKRVTFGGRGILWFPPPIKLTAMI